MATPLVCFVMSPRDGIRNVFGNLHATYTRQTFFLMMAWTAWKLAPTANFLETAGHRNSIETPMSLFCNYDSICYSAKIQLQWKFSLNNVSVEW